MCIESYATRAHVMQRALIQITARPGRPCGRAFSICWSATKRTVFLCVCVCVLAFALSLFCYACAGQLTNNKHTQKKNVALRGRSAIETNQRAVGRAYGKNARLRAALCGTIKPLTAFNYIPYFPQIITTAAMRRISRACINAGYKRQCTHTHTQRGRWVTGAVGDRLGEEEDKKTRRKRTQMQRTK